MERDLNLLTVKELKNLAKSQGLVGYSHLRKKELIRFIVENNQVVDIQYINAPIYFATPQIISPIFTHGPALLSFLEQMDFKTLRKFCASSKDIRKVCESFTHLREKINMTKEDYDQFQREKIFEEGLTFETTKGPITIDIYPKHETLIFPTIHSITSIPKEIGYLTHLKLLNLSHNKLKSIPDSIGNLESLRILNLSHNKLKSIPDSIGNLENLSRLHLGYNQLKSIPDSIGNLENLRILNLSHNKLKSIPDSIGNLENLSRLRLDYNKLKSLPDSIGNLENLRVLNLISNRLESIPYGVLKLPLDEFYYENNPLSDEGEDMIIYSGW